jgi:N-acyl-L-homoserine lactone synthetase
MRYKVYCLERGYERTYDHPDGLEQDEYDPYSIHFIAYLNSSPVGTVRLILENPFGFPVERYCNADLGAISQDADRIAEISRLAVSSNAAKGFSIERSKITLSLIKELYYTSRELRVRYLVCAMSKSLERLLNRCGMSFMRAGFPVDYHGLRTPYYAACDDLEKEVFDRRRDIFEFLFPAYVNS